ncbi:MAG: D-3-phosphoglycerate dehydrogenase [Pseudorhodobacter sp.]|jgi:D-3-phosphoglycerate dehydrogenase
MQRCVLITEPVHEDAVSLLTQAGWQVIGPGAPMQPADAVMVRVHPVTEAQVADFKMISKHGVGVDNIALTAANAAGVAVMNTPGANAGAVAEQAFLLMLALARNFDAQRVAMVAGQAAPRMRGLDGSRLLVIGFGASGQRLARLAQASGMIVTVQSRNLDLARAAGYLVAADLPDALRQADIVSLHCPLNATTKGLLNAQNLALLPKGAMVINCARGGLIDEAALVASLSAGHLAGAGLDVTQTEPLPKDHPLRQMPGVILTPHAAAMSDGAFRRMGMMAAQNILDHFAGQPDPAHIIVVAGPSASRA